MKKRMLLILISVLLVLSFTSIGCTTSDSPTTSAPATTTSAPTQTTEPQQTVTLRLAHDSSPGPKGGGPYHIKEAADEVTALTNGRVQFEFYWTESLLKKTEFLDGINAGTIDITEISPGSFVDKIPLSNVVATVPFEPSSVDKSQQAFAKIMQSPEILAEWDNWNAKVIGADLRPPKSIITSVPIKTLADVNGVKIRENAEANVKLWAAAGGVATYVAIPEVYEAIQRGVIQGMGADLGIAVELKLYEVCKYFHENLGFGAYIGFMVINQDSLNRLSAGDQQILLDTFGKMASRQIDALTANNEGYMEKAQFEVVHFADADLDKWRAMPEAESIVTDWVSQMNDKGLPGTEVMNTWLEALGLKPL